MRFAAVVLSAVFIPSVPVSGQAAPNPALLYWQGIALLPAVVPSAVQLIADVIEGRADADTAGVSALLESTRKSLDRFSRAASSAGRCEWGTTFDEGPFAPMPHLPKLQLLSRLALMNCERLFTEGRHAEALPLVLQVHRAARHAGADAMLYTVIVQHSIEQQAIRLTARHVARLDGPTRTRHLQALRELPALLTVREAISGEHTISEWLRHMVLGIQHSPESEKAMLDMARSLLQTQSQSPDAGTAQSAKETLKSVEEWKQAAEEARALQVRLDAASAKPWPEFQSDLQQMRLDLANASPTLRNLLPTFEGTMRKQCETATLHTMLQAAMTPDKELAPGTLPGFKDAFAGEPLQVEKDDAGIILTCREAGRTKPLSLRVAGKQGR